MSKISDYAASVQSSFDAISASVDGIQTDVTGLQAKIDALQNSSGEISPEDQALLDGIAGHATAIADRVAALDAVNPPAPPAGGEGDASGAEPSVG